MQINILWMRLSLTRSMSNRILARHLVMAYSMVDKTFYHPITKFDCSMYETGTLAVSRSGEGLNFGKPGLVISFCRPDGF
jgi:hypothetical protein